MKSGRTASGSRCPGARCVRRRPGSVSRDFMDLRRVEHNAGVRERLIALTVDQSPDAQPNGPLPRKRSQPLNGGDTDVNGCGCHTSTHRNSSMIFSACR